MRNAMVILNIGGKSIHPKSRHSFISACQRWGLEFVEIKEPVQPGVHHFWQKAFLIDSLQEYDRVLQLDADMLIRFDAPCPLDYCEPDEIGVISCHQFFHPRLVEIRTKCVKYWASKMKMKPCADFVHVNGGLLIYNPKLHQDLFKEWRSFGAPSYSSQLLPEQASLSVLLWNRRGSLKHRWLPHAFNVVAAQSPARQATSGASMDGWIYHFTGGNRKQKREQIMKTWWRCKSPLRAPGRSLEIIDRVPIGGKIAELGVYRGLNAKSIMTMRPDVNMVLHDIWQAQGVDSSYVNSNDVNSVWTDGIYLTILESIIAVNQTNAGHFMIRQVDLNTYTPPPGELYDLVFIDDDHTEKAVADRIDKWLPVVKPGGYIGGHDYKHGNKSWGVARAVASRFDVSKIETGRDLTWFFKVGKE